ncbi:MAG: acyl-CoA dehydrogenase [Thaumarchaeota archaeon]|nr:acyl-CoA dehydrogenase [Nitrososphaerota archaeon]|tara:strand:- start:185 stop:1390 length:1206 start_codon:yes stop_codon:yes gene_type:complete
MPFEFSFTDEQDKFRRDTREFLHSEILPSINTYDKNEEFPFDNIKKMSDRGYFGLTVPKNYGGLGLSKIEYGILLEELGAICASHATILGAHLGLCVTPIILYGTQEQKNRFLPSLSSGESLGAFALTEPSAGSDAANLQTTATPEGEDFILNGSKIFCTNGDHADFVIVFAANDKSLGPMGGITAFIVEKNTPGFTVGKKEKKMGLRASSTAELIFENCKVPKENILGDVGTGFMIALSTLDGGRITLAVGSLGAAQRALDLCIDYLRQNQSEGGNLANRQSIQWKLADVVMEVYASKYLVYNNLMELEKYYEIIESKEKVPRQLRDRVSRGSAISKAYVSEVASRAITRVIEIQGILGIQDGTEIERGFRDSFIAEIYEGTNDIQRMIIAKEILGIGLN